MEDLHSLVEVKWTGRVESCRQAVNKELNSFKRQSCILSQIGWKASGIDPTAKMIRHAESNAARSWVEPRFAVMDNHELDYPKASFDLLICRNVTRT